MRCSLGAPSGRHRFFWGGPGGGHRLRQEVFYLAFHLHWSRDDIMSMDLAERRVYVRMLAERIEADNRAFESLGTRSGGRR
ncbi:MAG: hypothetical protein EA350_03780 [Gemmatimonadales bacterium]|nr:MAG: hypothetical protein EA350_03780 [Gemmatimonadales bacterium]